MAADAVLEEARRLPPEPTSPKILGLFAASATLWLGVLIWQVVALPEHVPVQFEFGGPPTGWSSKTNALIFPVVMAVAMVLPAILNSRIVLRTPGWINAPNREWWTATASRLRRFERLLREDLLLLAAGALLLLAVIQVGITIAANSPGGEMPFGAMLAMLAPAVSFIAAIVRLCGGNGRYNQDPELS